MVARLLLLLLLAMCACQSTAIAGSDATTAADAFSVQPPLTWDPSMALPTVVVPGTPIKLAAWLRDANNKPVVGSAIAVTVLPASGKVDAAQQTSDAQGRIVLTWTPGPVPIVQGVRLQAGKETLELTAQVQLAQPAAPQPFGKVAAYMANHKLDGSTEDVAFAPDGKTAVMGVPDHLLQITASGDVTELATTGDKLLYPLGMAFDATGNLWFCDSKAPGLRLMTPDRHVATLTTTDSKQPLIQPNDLAIGPDGRIWFTDPCLGEVLRYDPKTKATEVLATFDLKTQGGPNGIALSPDGKDVVVTTENVLLTCGKGGAMMTDALGSLYRAPNLPGPLTFAPLAEHLGIFGDGCSYDALGNLYATFDQFAVEPAIAVKASIVLVWPKGQTQPQPFLSTTQALFANVVFGKGAFGSDQLYVALLTVPPFTPEDARGLQRYTVGPGLVP